MEKGLPENPVPIYQLKIVLRGIKPPVWRVLQIRGNANLGKLHDYLQGVMGWMNSHLHEFKIKGKRFRAEEQMYEEIDEPDVYDEKDYCINKLLKEGDSFEYEYDWGDCWEHDIFVEKILSPKEGVYYPICIYGERACPPDDCGGTMGYERLLEILRNPEQEEFYEDYSKGVSDIFDPEKFDLKETNRVLDNIKSNLREPRRHF